MSISSQKYPLRLKSSSNEAEDLMIHIARPEEAEEIAAFLDEYLHCKSPVVHMIAINPKPEEFKERKAFILKYTRDSLVDPLSLIVRKMGSGELVAIRINKMERLTRNLDDIYSVKSYPPMPDQLLFSILEKLGDGCDLFKLYGTDKVLHLFAVAVHPSQGRQGLASRLYNLSIELAVSAGAGAIAVEALSEYTIRATTKLGFQVHNVIDYASFEYHGKRPLADCSKLLADHSEARFMSRKLP